jgi:hypothetical protein
MTPSLQTQTRLALVHALCAHTRNLIRKAVRK